MEIARFAHPLSEIAPYTLPDYRLDPAYSTFSEYLDNLSGNDIEILNDYAIVTGAHNNLWQEIYKRTETKSWKLDPNGVGSCNVSTELSLSGVPASPLRQNLIELRKRVNNQTPQDGKNGGCPSHRPNIGCVVGVLKGPLCLDYEDLFMKPEIEKRFGICLMPVKPYLERISLGKADSEFAMNTALSINNLTEYIKSFPVLEE